MVDARVLSKGEMDRLEEFVRARGQELSMFRSIAFVALATVGMLNAAAPKFEAASVKPGCGALAPGRGGLSGGEHRVRHITWKDQYLVSERRGDYQDGVYFRSERCLTSMGGLRRATRARRQHWVYSDRYTIEAKAEGAPAEKVMMGPMLEGLLADRFHLTLRHEAEDAPMYALTVAKSGLKIRPMEAGGCTPRVPGMPNPVLAPGAKPLCNVGRGKVDGPNWVFDTSGMDLSGLVGYLPLT